MVIVYIGTGYIQVLYLGRTPRTKETLPDFHEWRRVTRHPLVFRGLTGSQRTPGNWGITASADGKRKEDQPSSSLGLEVKASGKSHCMRKFSPRI